ncbi:DNA helicase-2/ATP-dependent DNA helicase PcrA [Cryobacterium mesophilum]|uniref:DNA 3'-5' helicase n=1 Tax=Terrimesophilobacter mesophilus TaxID=433647 RepID=A0A4V3I9I7_9MICO|nr:UvrD-helicase domain-containing protein [Terrimesophilobacter mesophilus]MBB5632860.1 DNA helicase-2/ATP-dependent DNA helicase PcrA [Terrimesophilobacter mesophilus]TFB79638.1 ATP-dependent DNA helicase PcrA [Terrimesophilobacter mesophilus]
MTFIPELPDPALESRLLEGLNPQQREAVVHRGEALLIVAGAGSGKTSVLTRRIAHLIETKDAWPSQILAITFTNKAAAEMRERVETLIGQAAEGMWISTFHSACVRILRREAETFGYTKSFTIYDSADSRALIKRIIKDLDADTFGFTVSKVAGRISKAKNELQEVESYSRNANFADPAEAVFVEMFRRYSSELTRANAFDFDDLIAQTVYLFRAFPKVAALYQRRFRHILVDEYQDTNHAQYSLIRELTRAPKPEHLKGAVGFDGMPLKEYDRPLPPASLTVVGDSDQSIYAFRGADIRNIVEFERDFPNSKVILLEQNYRSTQNILSAANSVIANNFDRKDKKLFTTIGDGEKIVGFTGYSQHDEAQFIADEIVELREAGMDYRDVAVFYRTNAQTRALEDVFIRSALPYRVIGGTKFYERAEIKDAMAYLIAVANPADPLALRRIMNVPKRGIGPATEAALQNHADKDGRTLRDALRESDQLGLGPKVTAAIEGLATILDEVGATADTAAPADILAALLERTGFIEALRASRDPQDEARAENVEELLAVTREFRRNNPTGTLLDFLTEVSLVAAADELDDSSGTVSLMTLHTAKGLEFEAVFLTGVEEGLLPHQMSAGEPGGPAEERRLFYVGITRARRRLYLSLAMTRAQFGDVTVAMPSRYLQEIPTELIDWRQSPGMANSRGGTEPRALNARRGGFGAENSLAGSSLGGPGGYAIESGGPGATARARAAARAAERPKTEWTSRVTSTVRDNGDLTLAAGDRIRHVDFGDGKVTAVTGTGPKAVAEVQFETAGRKRLLIKISPIEKLA